jgi:glycosyltransferase involved in cell wall biosynthesis
MKTLQIGMGWFNDRAGGLNRYYYDCANHFAAADMQFDGLVAGGSNVKADSQAKVTAFAPANAPLFKRWLSARSSFQSLIAQQEYDLIVSHFAFYTFPLLNMLDSRPMVTHFHGPWALESDVEQSKPLAIWLKKQLEKLVYRRSQKFIVLSRTFRDILHDEYQVPLHQIEIVPGGVDLEHFNLDITLRDARHKISWNQERPTIFCIRRLAKRMGLENLVTAMSQVRQHYPDIMLYIAGKGALAETLQQQIEDLKLQENVSLLGYVADNDLPLCYRAANFSVIPTLALEGFGLIAIESLAAGTPVLGTPIGGIPEILRPLSQDLVFADCSSPKLAQGIVEALNGQRKLPSSEACLKYVQKNYTWEKVARQINSVYETAISGS